MSGGVRSSAVRRLRPLWLTGLHIVAVATILGPAIGGAIFGLCAIFASLMGGRIKVYDLPVMLSFLPASDAIGGLFVGALPAAIGGVTHAIADLLVPARAPRAFIAAVIGAVAAARLDVDFHGRPILTDHYWNVAYLGAIGAAAAIACALMGRRVGLGMQMHSALRGSPSMPEREDPLT